MKRWGPWLVGAAAFVVYFLTTCRSVWIGDSGEFALVLESLGIAHPPGYPLFTVLGAVCVQALGFLRPALAGGIYASFLAAGAVVVICLIFRRGLSDWTALALGLVWAFTPIFWAETNGVEIYTLNVLLIALCYWALESEGEKRWPLIVYLFGLCLCNHPSALALVPALLYAFIADREYRRVKRLPLYLALLVVAGTFYLYLWVRSTHDPATDWGNPEGLVALWQHMSLKQYSGWVGNSWDNLWFAARLFGRTIVECWTWLGAALILSGIILGWSVARRRTISAIMIMITAVVMAAFHQAVNHEPFYLPPLLAALLLIGNNLIWLERRRVPQAIAPGILAAAATVLLISNYQSQDRSSYTDYEEYSRGLLDAAPAGSLLFVAGDINSFGPLYLQWAEGYRREVEVYDRSVRKWPLIEAAREYQPALGDDVLAARAVILEHSPERKLFAKSHYQNEPSWWEGLDSLYSYGLLYETQPPRIEAKRVKSYPDGYRSADLMTREMIVNLDLARGEQKLWDEPPDSSGALADFRLALSRYDDEPRGVLLNQLGIFLRKIGAQELALEAYRRGLNKPILSGGQAAEIRYNISNVHKDRGNAALQAQDFVAAAAAFETAAEYDRDNARLLLNIGLLYARELDNAGKARPYLERYLLLEPSDAQARQLLNSLR